MPTWTVPGTVIRVVDGDTIRLRLDLGWNVYTEKNCRLATIDAPEVATDTGKAAKAFVVGLLPPGTAVTFVSTSLDNYGRPLGRLTFGPDHEDLAVRLRAEGLAVPYYGGKRG